MPERKSDRFDALAAFGGSGGALFDHDEAGVGLEKHFAEELELGFQRGTGHRHALRLRAIHRSTT
jgi:hypothetical protein